MSKLRISYARPSITELEVGYATDAARNGWGDRCYEYIDRFEKAFCRHLGVAHAIATSSCTGAMHMGLAALGVGPGDEVILADSNWIATVAPVVHLGAKPVFVDVLPDTWCVDPAQVESAVTPRTKAIIATHLYGNLCAMDQLLALSKSCGVALVEDAAEAMGSVYHGKRAGSMGSFGTFSFHGSKTMTTGEGGMFVTDDPALYERVLTLSNHGRSRNQTRQFWPDMVGYKYKMSNIQAAIGLAQIERIEELTGRKREIFASYRESLAGVAGLSMNPEYPGTVNGCWMPTVMFSREAGVSRETLVEAFRVENVDARVFFHPLSSLDFFPACPANLNSYSIPQRAINIPSFHDITEAEIARVVAVIEAVAA